MKTIQEIVLKEKTRQNVKFATFPPVPRVEKRLYTPRPKEVLSRDSVDLDKVRKSNYMTSFWFRKGKCSATRPKD